MQPTSGSRRIPAARTLFLAALLLATSTVTARASHESIVVDGDLTDLISAVNANLGPDLGGFTTSDPLGDIYPGGGCSFVNGYDIRQSYVFFDFKDAMDGLTPNDVTLYVGWDMEGIVGDLDGDGNQDTFNPVGPGAACGAFADGTGISGDESYSVLLDLDCSGAIDDIRIQIRNNQVLKVVSGVPSVIAGAQFAFNADQLELQIPNYQTLIAGLPITADLCDAHIRLLANAEFDFLGEDLTTAVQLEVAPLILVVKSPVAQLAVAGNPATWTMTVVNSGLCVLNSVSVTDTLDAELSYVTAIPAPIVNGQELSWEFPNINLAPGQTIQINLTANTSQSCDGPLLINSVTAAGTHVSSCASPPPAAAVATATVSVRCPATANCRFAETVLGFSTEFSPTAWAATEVLGPPDVYPAYGDIAAAWAPSTPDGGLEFLELGFADPAPINFVNVYETYSPGTITTISVFSPFSGLFEIVWTATPSAAPLVSRIYTAIFPETPFPVSQVRIEFDCMAVPDWNEIDAVAIGKCDRDAGSQWASSVVAFSSEFSPTGWGAQEALGPPDTYPAYGDISSSWAPSTEDGQQEFLELGFPNPVPINIVRVVETNGPGTLEKVSVKNPNTGLFEEVWAGAASPAPEVARILEISFPETEFPVSEVRLDFNSPAVPGWNEIDAVAIARCDCPTIVSGVAPPAEVAGISTIERLGPNPFTRSTGIRFSLARGGPVSIDVFDLSGRRVATILDGTLPAGGHEFQWNGIDVAGREVANGIYYLRMESSELRRSLKVVKVR